MLEKNEQILNQIQKANNILITGYSPWNEEIIPASLALKSMLKKMGKGSRIVITADDDKDYIKPSREVFSIFKNFEGVETSLKKLSDFVVTLNLGKTKLKKVKYKISDESLKFFITPNEGFFSPEDVDSRYSPLNFDLIITLGTPDLELLGENYEDASEFFYQTPIINIDYHASNEEYGQINLIELTKTSTAEILYYLFEDWNKEKLDEEIATSLLGGIIYKTKNFKTPVTPQTLTATSNLIGMGADKETIINKFYRSKSLNAFKLWGRALNKLSALKEENRLIWTTILEDDFKQTETGEKDLIDLVDEIIINIPKIEVLVIFYQKEGSSNALVYCKKNIDLKNLFEKYSPEGNNKIVQIRGSEKIDDFKKDIIKTVKRKLDNM